MRRGWLLVLIGWACFVLSSPPGLRGAEDYHPAGKAPEGKDHGDKGHAEDGGPGPLPWGHPALDLALWTIVVFLLLLFVLGRWAWRPMLEGLDARERNIRAAAEDAQRARDEAQALREQLQAEMARANDKVRAMLDESRKEAHALKEEMIGEARKEIQAERERLHREVDLARDDALQQIWTQGVQLAALISSKTIRRQLTPEDHRDLVDEALADLRLAGNGCKHT
jgi:F-type H+-transporting ATPase subunit b